MKQKREGQERIFPELRKIQYRYSHYASRRLNEYFRDKCGITEKDKNFHSFRHTFINYLKQNDFELDKIKQLAGHANTDMTFGTYGKRYEPEKLYHDVISKIDYNIDLSHLKNSKYIIQD